MNGHNGLDYGLMELSVTCMQLMPSTTNACMSRFCSHRNITSQNTDTSQSSATESLELIVRDLLNDQSRI